MAITGKERIGQLQPLTGYLAHQFLSYLESLGVNGTVTSGQRSLTDQARLYWLWVTGQSRIPAARPGQSQHEIGRAFDFVPGSPYTAEDVRHIAEYFWFTSGLSFRTADPVHYQLACPELFREGYRIPECFAPVLEV